MTLFESGRRRRPSDASWAVDPYPMVWCTRGEWFRWDGRLTRLEWSFRPDFSRRKNRR